jgi:hypothetical protein
VDRGSAAKLLTDDLTFARVQPREHIDTEAVYDIGYGASAADGAGRTVENWNPSPAASISFPRKRTVECACAGAGSLQLCPSQLHPTHYNTLHLSSAGACDTVEMPIRGRIGQSVEALPGPVDQRWRG